MSFNTNINKLLVALVFLLLFSATTFFAWNYFKKDGEINLVIGAGSKKGEAYQFAQAIASVTKEHFPDINIKVLTTAGSKENMKLLESGEIDLATVQADIDASPSSRIVSNLYPDMYQLIVRKDANINSFRDLKGKRIALPSRGGGQWVSFWFTANHYGLTESDITNISLSSSAAVDAIINGEIDAIFKVRALRNQTILNIISSCPSKLIPITQGAAMKLKQPVLNVGIIPQGAYTGDHLVPQVDLTTIAVERLLVAHKNTNPEAIRAITQVLFERRLELLKTTSLAGFISQPNWNAGTFIPVHKGSRNFFEREKPSFFVENADFVALILSVLVMVFSGLFGARKKAALSQKNLADVHTRKLIEIMNSIYDDESVNLDFLLTKKETLRKMLSEVVIELDKDQLTPEGFQFFSFTWNTVYKALVEKEAEYK